MTQALKECPYFDKEYTLAELEDYVFYYNVPTAHGNNAAVLAHFYFPKDSLYADELEVVWEKDLGRVWTEKQTLANFVRAIAEGQTPSATEASEVLAKISEKDFF